MAVSNVCVLSQVVANSEFAVERSHPSEGSRSGPKPRPVVGDFAWGAEAIGRVIGRDEKATFHLIYNGALDGAVKKINGRHVGSVAKLRALMGGE
jgi:hypothetical protein